MVVAGDEDLNETCDSGETTSHFRPGVAAVAASPNRVTEPGEDFASMCNETAGVEVAFKPLRKTVGHWLELSGPQFAFVEASPGSARAGGSRDQHPIFQHNHSPAIAGVKTVGTKLEVVPVVRARQSECCGGENRISLGRVRGDLMGVRIDVESRDDSRVVVSLTYLIMERMALQDTEDRIRGIRFSLRRARQDVIPGD